mmetsp:Transcript_15513/g.37892  ORF Transcript_15513/g.37892 Transcript_15513/m.37892 type:complete len:213 (+) Transcript_15513:310-948(+)
MALNDRETTAEGFEKQLAVNHFAHHYLYRLLEERLCTQKSPSRVVSLASTAHTFGQIDVDDLHYERRKYTPWGAYGQSKLANLLFAKSVADRTADTGVSAVSVHPGVIKTPLWRHTPAAAGVGGFLLSLVATDKTIPQGASTSVYACLAPECARDDYAGTYLSDCAPAVPSVSGRDAVLRDALWHATEEQLAKAGYELPTFAPTARTATSVM